MTNYQFLQTYIQLQHGIMFDTIVDLGFATICHSQQDPSPFWNNAVVNTILTDQQIQTIETQLQTLNRTPALYFEHKTELHPLLLTLQKRGYSQDAEDSIMFYAGASSVDTSQFSAMKKVMTESDLEIFLHTFDLCYRKDDPVNPYGELGEYLNAARTAWRKHHASNSIQYFMAYENNEPVAVATLTNHNGLGYISNVGSILKVRGKGFGKLVTLYCVHQSQLNGNSVHSLATEEGTNPHAFYTALGFETKFTTLLLSKKEGILTA